MAPRSRALAQFQKKRPVLGRPPIYRAFRNFVTSPVSTNESSLTLGPSPGGRGKHKAPSLADKKEKIDASSSYPNEKGKQNAPFSRREKGGDEGIDPT